MSGGGGGGGDGAINLVLGHEWGEGVIIHILGEWGWYTSCPGGRYTEILTWGGGGGGGMIQILSWGEVVVNHALAGPAQPIGQVGHLPYHFFPRLR